jgi:isopentenyldiphosphate isomerase
MEYLDVYDENGNFLGKEDRKIVHRDALWHNTVHCWLYDDKGNVYFQIRKDKSKLYTTASGHVQAGETIKEAFGREIYEEIGYPIDYNEAKKIEIVKFIMDREESDGSLFRDRAFANVYACLFNDSLDKLDFDESELLGIVKVNAKKTLDILKKESGSLIGEKSHKENGKVIVSNEKITFDDFLVNKGETAITKYGNVLKFIINEITK